MAAIAPAVTCTVRISASTYKDLCEFLAEDGDNSQTAIEAFVDKAIRSRMFDEDVRQIKEANAGVSEEELMAAIDEALEWARAQK